MAHGNECLARAHVSLTAFHPRGYGDATVEEIDGRVVDEGRVLAIEGKRHAVALTVGRRLCQVAPQLTYTPLPLGHISGGVVHGLVDAAEQRVYALPRLGVTGKRVEREA